MRKLLKQTLTPINEYWIKALKISTFFTQHLFFFNESKVTLFLSIFNLNEDFDVNEVKIYLHARVQNVVYWEKVPRWERMDKKQWNALENGIYDYVLWNVWITKVYL